MRPVEAPFGRQVNGARRRGSTQAPRQAAPAGDGDDDLDRGRGRRLRLVVGSDGRQRVVAREDVLPSEAVFVCARERAGAEEDAVGVEVDLGDGAVRVQGVGLEGDAARPVED